MAAMDRRYRERITKQWGWLGDSDPRERARATELERDLEGSPLRGRRLPSRFRLGSLGADRYVAALGGPLPYMQRLREIEHQIEQHEEALAAAWDELAAECDGDGEAFASRWREIAHGWRFDEVNDLISRHNRWYPAESRLPMDPRTGDFTLIRGRSYRRDPLDADWVLERFPAERGSS
jgi:hypothetical protein